MLLVPLVTIEILERFLLLSISVTVKLSILYPLPENKPITLAKVPGSLFTTTVRVLILSFSSIFNFSYIDIIKQEPIHLMKLFVSFCLLYLKSYHNEQTQMVSLENNFLLLQRKYLLTLDRYAPTFDR